MLGHIQFGHPFRSDSLTSKQIHRKIQGRLVQKGPWLIDGCQIFDAPHSQESVLHHIRRLLAAPKLGGEKPQQFTVVLLKERGLKSQALVMHDRYSS